MWWIITDDEWCCKDYTRTFSLININYIGVDKIMEKQISRFRFRKFYNIPINSTKSHSRAKRVKLLIGHFPYILLAIYIKIPLLRTEKEITTRRTHYPFQKKGISFGITNWLQTFNNKWLMFCSYSIDCNRIINFH